MLNNIFFLALFCVSVFLFCFQPHHNLFCLTVVEDIHCKGVASAMPTNMLVNAGMLHPPFNGFAAAFV